MWSLHLVFGGTSNYVDEGGCLSTCFLVHGAPVTEPFLCLFVYCAENPRIKLSRPASDYEGEPTSLGKDITKNISGQLVYVSHSTDIGADLASTIKGRVVLLYAMHDFVERIAQLRTLEPVAFLVVPLSDSNPPEELKSNKPGKHGCPVLRLRKDVARFFLKTLNVADPLEDFARKLAEEMKSEVLRPVTCLPPSLPLQWV